MPCQAKMDDETCDECAFFNTTDFEPPVTDCRNPNGCRCRWVEDNLDGDAAD